MRVTFSTGDPKTTRDFFSQGGTYLDISITENSVFIISTNGIDLYAHKEFPIISLENYEPGHMFRTDRKAFLSLIKKGHVALYIPNKKEVEISFVSEGFTCMTARTYQQSDVTSLQKFTSVLKNRTKFSPMHMSAVTKYTSLIRQFGGLILVEDGVLHTGADHVKVYCRVPCSNFCLLPAYIFYLLNNSDMQYAYQESIIGIGEDSVIVMKQSSYGMHSGLEWIVDPKGSKNSHMAKVDFTHACTLATSCELEGLAVVDFDMKAVHFSKERAVYRTDIKVHEIKSRAQLKQVLDLTNINLNDDAIDDSVTRVMPKLEMTTKLFRNYLSSVDRTNVRVSLRRDFIVMDIADEVYFVIGRSEVA